MPDAFHWSELKSQNCSEQAGGWAQCSFARSFSLPTMFEDQLLFGVVSVSEWSCASAARRGDLPAKDVLDIEHATVS